MSARARVAALAALASACASTTSLEEGRHVSALALDAYGEQEECAHLDTGDRLDYSFSADTPVGFNIHYHDAGAIVEPIVRDAVTEDSGVFVVALAQDYCLMWQAGAAPATLDYRVRVRRGER
jgi:hypothetical protein